MVVKIKNALGGLENKIISILGLTFKPNTDDMRESPSLVIVSELKKVVSKIKVYDPAGMSNAKKLKEFDGVEWCNNAYDCISNANAMIVITEWNEFRALDLIKVKKLLQTPVIIDLRNVYNKQDMDEAKIKYFSVGRSE